MVAYRARKVKAIATGTVDTLGQSVVDLSKYVEDEFAEVARSLQATDKQPVLNAAPPKPRVGTVAVADGTHWNPGAGEGPYYFDKTGTWNSLKAPNVSGFLTDAPSDGNYYGRQNAAWAVVPFISDAPNDATYYARHGGAWSNAILPLSGGTLTGFLTLNADPASNLQAATKQYVDNSIHPGGWRLLATLTASNSPTLSDTTSLTNAYSEYEIVFSSLIPATAGVTLNLQVHSGGAFKTTGYMGSTVVGAAGAVAAVASTTAVQISNTGAVTNVNPGVSGHVRCYNPSANQITNWSGEASYMRSGLTIGDVTAFGGAWITSAVVDGFQIAFSSGNITSGTVKIYGR